MLDDSTTEIDSVITDPNTPPRAVKQLTRANAQIERAGAKWAEDNGKRALNSLRRSIGDLEDSIRDGASPSQVQPIIDQLLGLILSEAQEAVQDAIDRSGNARRIQAAQDRIARGGTESEASRAAKWYTQAFIRASKA